MLLLSFFAFLAGIVTILSPCILPLLPIILSSTASQSKKHPYGVVVGFIASFTFFTLFLTKIVQLFNLPADILRTFAVVVILTFGLVLVIPKLYVLFEIFASKLSSKAKIKQNENAEPGFLSGLLVGTSLGIIWTPCAGPILASVISLAITGTVTGQSVIITLSYAVGTAIPMLAILFGGRAIITKVPGLLKNLANIQKVFGALMILTALAIFFNFDRQFQTYILDKFPSYGEGLTSIENNDTVQKLLKQNDMEIITAPELEPTGEWFNSDPLTLEELRGKVVLVDFWTFSCINCIRTLPYLQDWHEKYADDGLVIIGVHSPEFEFEKDPDALQKAINDFGLTYPIVQDNEFKTWRAYQNRYWPAKYLVDANGTVRYTHFGEGKYEETEAIIQSLLKESGSNPTESLNEETYEIFSATPETYLGYKRMEFLASPEAPRKDEARSYTYPAELPENTFAFEGEIEIGPESSNPKAGSKLKINFKSKEVFLVMNPNNAESSQAKIYLDGELINEYAGSDVKDGVITITSDRLYKLVKLAEQSRHTLEIEFLDSNTNIFAFTFG